MPSHAIEVPVEISGSPVGAYSPLADSSLSTCHVRMIGSLFFLYSSQKDYALSALDRQHLWMSGSEEHEVKYERQLISNGNPMEAVVGFSRAVRVGPYITVGGTAPVGEDGKTVGLGDVRAQTRQCLEIVKAALEQAGSGLHDVVRTRVILTDIDNWRDAIEVRKEYFRDVRPVDTIMAVTRFVNPEWMVEIEVDAVVADHD